MSSASLALSHRPHPDSTRIAAISAALVLNLAVLVIASRPILPGQLSPAPPPALVPVIRLIEPPATVPPPAPVVLPPLHTSVVLPHVQHPPQSLGAPPAAMPTTEGSDATPPISSPALSPVTAAPVAAATPIEASLAYRYAPVKFPLQALRQRMHGVVLLRVLVDESGQPLDVQVERGSGYPMLDRSAREQVLAGWRFQPALVNGRAVRAWARVPVKFDLKDE